jgi:hypothetical protein
MHAARIPPVDPAEAIITAVVAMHAGHICLSSELHGGNTDAGIERPGSDKCGGNPMDSPIDGTEVPLYAGTILSDIYAETVQNN